ncbi:THUMP domain-containing class I SAM-dependent RNA methyltransferase [Ancylomarina longa]|uniref:RNA methyltransferase n=1 Tax=Ancylomarina longa TaxID=2487017 RepID=A0A434AYH8_9BACT|nr:THUMP domain-containing protein [Ancylomarina longa]RUT79622.1 RNA methyltransferase [Ancylomarina longa]
MKKDSGKFRLIAKTFQGLEEVLSKELEQLGAEEIRILKRAVSFVGDKTLLYKTNLHLRTATRVIKPIHKFTAHDTDELYKGIQEIDWGKYIANKDTIAIDSTVSSEDFKHSQFVTYRVKDAIVDQFFYKTGDRPSVRVVNPSLRINVHIDRNTCTVSLDSSGESLHKRGYRVGETAAPLNEVLAAGLILLSDWDKKSNFIDPMCGSGTILIEAALIAYNIPPGLYRKEFGFQKWRDFDEELWDEIYNDETEVDFDGQIIGADISDLAMEIAEANIRNAGLIRKIKLNVIPFQQFTPPVEKGLLITNPPYGERLKLRDLDGLYSMIGERLKHHFMGYDAWILSYAKESFNSIALRPSRSISLFNGPLECKFQKYSMYEGKKKDKYTKRD